jgi:hypothetical protein
MAENKATKATIKNVTENFRKLSKTDKQQVIAFMLGMMAARQDKPA